MNNDYTIKKAYAEQKHQIQIYVYENGIEKTKKIPLCDVRMVVDDEVVDLVWLVREAREQKLKVIDLEARLKLQEEKNTILSQAVKDTIDQVTIIAKGGV